MSGKENVPFSGTTGNQLKKSVGKIIIKINSEILELLIEYRKVKPGVALSPKGVSLELAIKGKQEALEEGVKGLEKRPEFVISEKMEKTVKMIKENVDTAKKVLMEGSEGDQIPESEISTAKNEAVEAVKEMEEIEKEVEAEMKSLTANLSSLAPTLDLSSDSKVDPSEEEKVQYELQHLDQYNTVRFERMKKDIKRKMNFHREDLKTKWNAQKDILDYQALKEIRYEFEGTHKKMRFMVNEWDKRKVSDILCDHLMDKIDGKWDEYMENFRKMDEEKRTDAAVIRKKNLEIEEYKREKKKISSFMA